jgi:hypothetical protein
MLACLVSMAWHHGFAAEMPRPEDGVVADGVYANDYFDLSYPLPAGWTEDVAGPAPSASGYYVLASLVPGGQRTGTILIGAQDLFFVSAPSDDPAAVAQKFYAAMSRVAGMRVERPIEVALAGREFSRVDFSGVGLYRSTFFTESRCHLLSFNFTANSPQRLATLVLTLERLARAGAARPPDPPCLKGHASAENLLSKVDPAPSGPAFTPIPVRIVVGRDGSVRHVHVIRAGREQASGIEAALAQWRFKPYVIDGRAAAVETGLSIEFRANGAVVYSSGDGG